jgi:hypothetical protein
LEKLAREIVDTINKHAEFYQRFKDSLSDQDIAQSLKRMETYVFVLARLMDVSTLRGSSRTSLLQLMKDRCDEERHRRASLVKRLKALFSLEDLEKDICDLRDRLNEEHRSWMVSLEPLHILMTTV